MIKTIVAAVPALITIRMAPAVPMSYQHNIPAAAFSYIVPLERIFQYDIMPGNR